MDSNKAAVFVLSLCLYVQSTTSYWAPGVIRFRNNICNTFEGYSGVCLRKQQCRDSRGVSSGTCANKVGRCCLYQGFCGGSSSNNNTYFINRGYPATFSGSTFCSFTIQPNDNVCQIRLDFLNLILAQPDGNGNCVSDSLVITGSGTGNVPTICGENSGQHMYLMVNGKNGISIRITTSALISMARSWNIKITQIACDCPTQAPIGCLQYFTSQSGTVTSFNYGTSINGNNVNIGTTMAVPGSRQIANHNYGICIGTLPGYCSINWRQSSDSESFTVTGDSATAAATTGLPGAALTGVSCTTDYVVISNPYFPNGMAVNTDRFCGNSFPGISSSSKPFILTTVTNSDEAGDVANRGFSLDFNQVACANFAYLMFTG